MNIDTHLQRSCEYCIRQDLSIRDDDEVVTFVSSYFVYEFMILTDPLWSIHGDMILQC